MDASAAPAAQDRRPDASFWIVAARAGQHLREAPGPGPFLDGAARPVIAARLLGLSEKTVRAWAGQGALAVAQRASRLLLDLESVHVISHISSELRAVGQGRGRVLRPCVRWR
jgi:hypothetical protein